MNSLSDPLTDDELDRLGEFLLDRIDDDADTDGKDEGVLNVSVLDGLFTALVSGPEAVMPSAWLPALWGDFPPVWENEADMGAMLGLLMRHMNSIARHLLEEPETFEPLFQERVVKGRTYTIVDDWCEGYVRGVALSAAHWQAAGAEMAVLLAPIRAFTAETDWYAHEHVEDKLIDELRDAIAPNVRAMHAYWLARRAGVGRAQPVRRTEPRVGRNDPCPCGSGRKYKHCCLH